MKKFAAWVSRHTLPGFYALAAVLTVLSCLLAAGYDALGFATGRLSTQQIPLEQLAAQEILCTEEGIWVTIGADPQFLVEADGQPVRNIVWQTDAPAAGAEGYYAKNGAGFSLRRRVWARRDAASGALVFRFPLSGGSLARIDPAGDYGVVLAENGAHAVLTVNARLPLTEYFRLRSGQWFWLVLGPALAAALWDQAAWWLKKRKKA